MSSLSTLKAPLPADRPTARFAVLRSAFSAHGPLSMGRRREALGALADALVIRADDFAAAVSADFDHRSIHETKLADIFPVVAALRHARRHLRQWAKPERRPIDLMFRPGRGQVVSQALGVVGIVGPWNYPIQLTLGPLAGALAAGNRVLIKPSELTPRTAALVAEVVAELFAPDEVSVVQGDADVAEEFCALAFDHLLFTGSTATGRKVMAAAARNLVPVTLELGGKSPAIVATDYPLEKAAERIAVGKLFNAGQTCIAPDYVLVPKGQQDAFIAAYREAVRHIYPGLQTNPDYSAIASDKHVARLLALVEDAKQRGATLHDIVLGAEASSSRRLAPLILTGVPDDATIMQDEIFGPLLPLIAYEDPEDAFRYVNARSRPLALYMFSNDEALVERALFATTSGGVTVNDTLLHCVQEELPFGGVGPSGMGSYHGEAGFRTFSHRKSVFRQSRINGAGMTRPPYGKRLNWLLNLILR